MPAVLGAPELGFITSLGMTQTGEGGDRGVLRGECGVSAAAQSSNREGES